MPLFGAGPQALDHSHCLALRRGLPRDRRLQPLEDHRKAPHQPLLTGQAAGQRIREASRGGDPSRFQRLRSTPMSLPALLSGRTYRPNSSREWTSGYMATRTHLSITTPMGVGWCSTLVDTCSAMAVSKTRTSSLHCLLASKKKDLGGSIPRSFSCCVAIGVVRGREGKHIGSFATRSPVISQGVSGSWLGRPRH